MNPVVRTIWRAKAQIQEGISKKGGRVDQDTRDLKNAFETMELVPLRLPSITCLFCVGDLNLEGRVRFKSYSRIVALRKHVDGQHLV